MDNLEYGTIVEYNLLNGELKGRAKIVGIAHTGVPFLGKGYILEDKSDNMPNVGYPYRIFVCFELFFNIVE